jgi:hypothetical protein
MDPRSDPSHGGLVATPLSGIDRLIVETFDWCHVQIEQVELVKIPCH